MSIINDRKTDHIRIVNEVAETERDHRYFDKIKLSHRALPELDFSSVDTSTNLFGKKLSLPLIISSMTGGDHPLLKTINRHLAEAAEETGIGLGVGSQRIMIEEPLARESFALRQYAPTALMIANLGAVQLNYGYGLKEVELAIEAVGADAIYFHCNPLQEAIQPEGDLNFAGLIKKISRINQKIEQAVIIKEVGSGVSEADLRALALAGIRYIDLAGSGGTSWSVIEQRRGEGENFNIGDTFADWGIPTPLALTNAIALQLDQTYIASGGLRNGLDLAKSVILGAQCGGIAKTFLEPAMESTAAVVKVVEQIRAEFRLVMFLLGAQNVEQLQGQPDKFILHI